MHAPRIHGLSTQAHNPDRKVESKPRLEQAGRNGSDLKAHHAPAAGCSRPHPREYHPATNAAAERPLSGRTGSKLGSGSSTHGRACTQRIRGETPSPRRGASGYKSGDSGRKHKLRHGKHRWTFARKVVKRRRLSGRAPTPPVPVPRGQGQFVFSEADGLYIENLMWWAVKQNAKTSLYDISRLAGDAVSTFRLFVTRLNLFATTGFPPLCRFLALVPNSFKTFRTPERGHERGTERAVHPEGQIETRGRG